MNSHGFLHDCTICLRKLASMSQEISQTQLFSVIRTVNQSLKVSLLNEDFRSANYSTSSIEDILVQKICDELNGEWTSDMAFHKLRSAISKATGKDAGTINLESDLQTLFPSSQRKDLIKKVGEELGFPVDVLKPNGFIYGFFIVLFFACIPVGIGMDWFLAGIVMLCSAVIIYILGKTGNQFRMKTVGHLADHLAWKNYLRQKRNASPVDEAFVRNEVKKALSA